MRTLIGFIEALTKAKKIENNSDKSLKLFEINVSYPE